jgi:hypothetical protein
MSKNFWLIESGPVSAPIYLGMVGEHPYWTFNLSMVARFISRNAAQDFLDAMIAKNPLIEYRLAEHGEEIV